MAIGSGYNSENSNNNKQNYRQEHYSPYSFSNIDESAVEPSKLSVSYWSNMLKLTISPMKKSNDGTVAFDHENGISIHMTHVKAKILSIKLKRWIKKGYDTPNIGINTGSSGLILFTNGKEFNVKTPVIVIRNIDQNTGDTKSEFTYTIRTDYHYGIDNFDAKTKDFKRDIIEDLELQLIIDVLDYYCEATTGAMAAAVVDENRFNNSRINTKVDSICEKLGIDFGKQGKFSGGGNSYFNGNGKSGGSNSSSGSKSSSMDELDDSGLDDGLE